MRELIVILVVTGIVSQVSGYLIKVPSKTMATSPVTDQNEWVHKQKLIIPLFENVCETNTTLNANPSAQNFNFDRSNYVKPEVITNLENLVSTGLLPKNVIFSEYQPDHSRELKIIYEVLINAKDFSTFYIAATWARQNLNCALYVNALYMAIQNRRDTEGVSIPAPYELFPNYFIDQNVIIQAAKISGKDYDDYVVPAESIHSEGESYILDANYTSLFYDNDENSKLAYFREDIGLNSYYYLEKLKMAPWLNSDINDSFGENMFQMMKQLMARYNLERYANGLPQEEDVNWDAPIYFPYDPMLIYSNGVEFSHRTLTLNRSENEDLLHLQTIENNISTIVDHLNQRGYNKTQILNHLMEILVTGDRSYETLSRQLLGKDLINNGDTSVLDHYMTSLRDPMFWKINTKIVNMIDEALKILPTYTKNELLFPGVEIVNIDVKKMTTSFDYFTFDVTDALKIGETGFRIKVGQPRLNHKQFTIKVNITSLVSQKGIMKVYLGPEILPGELVSKKNLFVLLDVCSITLKVGTNVITRTSSDMVHFSEDFMQLNTIRKKVEYAEFGLNSLPFRTINSQVEYPSRLILPKGTPQGLTLQMFVFVAPYLKTSFGNSFSRNNLKFNAAILSPGYPLDLLIQDQHIFGLPNAMTKRVTVTQKGENKVENYGGPGVTKSWYTTNTYDSSARPNYKSGRNEFEGKNENFIEDNVFKYDEENLENSLYLTNNFDYSSKRKPFDYQAKKKQFDKKDYSSRRNFTKYYTTTKNEDDIVESTTASETLSSTEKYGINIFNEDNLSQEKANTKEGMNIIKELDDTMNKDRQDNYLQVEPLPMPAMLKKESEQEKFNYKVKKTERDYKIKEKKVELDKLIKDAKMKHKVIQTNRLIDSKFNDTKTSNFEENFVKVNFSNTDLKNIIQNVNDLRPTSSDVEVYDSNDSVDGTFFG